MKRLITCAVLSAALGGGLVGSALAREDDSDAARLEQAKQRLEEAAREIAEISGSLAMDEVQKIVEGIDVFAGRRAMLGVAVEEQDEDEDGVRIAGVSPGGPAQAAGLEAGDVLISLNGEPLEREGRRCACRKLVRLMRDVTPGETVTVEYLRDGKKQSVQIETEEFDAYAFAFSFDDHDFDIEIPDDLGKHFERRRHRADSHRVRHWRHMELIMLTPKLGSYFGTEEGLLVVRAPEDKELKIQDGDVILHIGGRTPHSPEHAMRILRSYQAGEKLEIDIVRDKKHQTLEIEIPRGKSDARATDPASFDWDRPARTPTVRIVDVPGA